MSAPSDLSSPLLPSSLVLAGAGKMGAAMLEGWLASGLAPERVAVVDPHPAPTIAALPGLRLNPAPGTLAPPEVLVLAIKPQVLDGAAANLSSLAGPGTLVLSIMAGRRIAAIERALPRAGPVVRAMPNLPASIGRGMTGAFAGERASGRQRRMADTLLAGIGAVAWLPDEDALDAVTAVSGSGPAYLFLLAESLTEAGRALGLAPDLAARLARETVIGSAELLARSGSDPADLRRAVTSPGGTTAAALAILMAEQGGLPSLLRDAVAAAARRAGELSG